MDWKTLTLIPLRAGDDDQAEGQAVARVMVEAAPLVAALRVDVRGLGDLVRACVEGVDVEDPWTPLSAFQKAWWAARSRAAPSDLDGWWTVASSVNALDDVLSGK